MKRPALLIIDMQNDFVLEGKPLRVSGAEVIIPHLQEVLRQFRSRVLPIFHIVRVHRPDGSDVEIMRQNLFAKTPFAVEGTHGAAVIDDIAPLQGEYVLPKIRMSAFIGTGLDLTLKTLGVDHLVVSGIQTPNCIRTTVFDGMAYNYPVSLVEDATAAQTLDIHYQNVRDMANIGVNIIKTGDIAGLLSEIDCVT